MTASTPPPDSALRATALGPALAAALVPGADPDDWAAEGLSDLLSADVDADSVPALRSAQAGMPYFTLLRDLVRLGEASFVLRLAVLTEFASSDRTRWDQDTLASHFAWLQPEARAVVLRSLRKGGWLEVIEGSHRLTDRGEALYAVISRILGIEAQEGDLALGVVNVELSRDLGQEATPALKHLHHNLRRIVDGAEEAVRSHSEVRVLEARDRIGRNLAWAKRARACMEGLDLADDDRYRVAQEVGQTLGELHQWQAVLQRAIGDLSAKRLQLGRTGLSVTDVTSFLMRCDLETLADFGRPLVSMPVQPLFLILDNALSEAEYEYTQAPDYIEGIDGVGWAEGPPLESPAGDLELPEFTALDRFVADIAALAAKGGSQKLSTFVPRREWAESAYRLSLLALGETVGGYSAATGAPDAATAAVLHAFSEKPFEVEVAGDGSDRDRIYTESASEVSRGVVRIRVSGH
jgi:hypothetical protein